MCGFQCIGGVVASGGDFESDGIRTELAGNKLFGWKSF